MRGIMISSVDPTNKHSIEYNNSIHYKFVNICKPLFDNFPITHFFYIKILDNNTILYLCNEKKWVEFYIENKFQDDLLHIQTYAPKGLSHALWAGFKQDNIYSAVYNFNIRNGFNIYERENNSTITYAFGSTLLNEEMINFYINNLCTLKEFTKYFKHKAADIIDASDSRKLIISNRTTSKSYLREKEISIFPFKNNIQRFSFFEGKIFNINLSNREATCLYQLTTGKGIKEIARLLNISPRTVESHLNHVKQKSGYNTKADLVKMFNDFL
jgi:LuxR family quorum-sensing system transcriptional regulator SolR